MNSYQLVNSKYFVVTGISHHQADVPVRERFSLGENNARKFTTDYMVKGGEAIFILSTCNRMEVYALTDDPDQIVSLLLKHSNASAEDYLEYCYIKKNEEAIRHLFEVAVGLDSQILGDFEIIGQLKKAFRLSKEMGASNAFTERLMNTVSQCSKQVKNNTDFSSGAASASYAAVQYVKEFVPNYRKQKVLLYGTGKIGRNVCENLTKHLDLDKITVVNRSLKKASDLVFKYDIHLGKHEDLPELITAADVIIVSTGAPDPTITPEMILDDHQKYFIDLSMPRNVSMDVSKMAHITSIDLDTLSSITDSTVDKRKEEISKVHSIIDTHFGEFYEWLKTRKFVPTINAIKQRLEGIQQSEINKHRKETENFNEHHVMSVSSDIIKKITNQLSNQLRSLPEENIELIHHLFKIDSKEL